MWLTQKLMAELFQKDVRTINEHIKNIYAERELEPAATIREFRIVQNEGTRQVSRLVDFYNLDVIISVGYRDILKDAGRISAELSKEMAEAGFEKYMLKQRQLEAAHPTSDFDKALKKIDSIGNKDKI